MTDQSQLFTEININKIEVHLNHQKTQGALDLTLPYIVVIKRVSLGLALLHDNHNLISHLSNISKW